jgi:hypothetical protein
MSYRILVLVVMVAFAKAVTAQTTVVELFTSQGCSSCLPADELLAEVQKKYGDDVITLSYHVDYWDYIGWKDPFASKAYTQKQYEYASAFGARGVYTPQAIINGNSHFTGSDSRKMQAALLENTLDNRTNITLGDFKNTGSKLWIPYTLNELSDSNSLTFALTIKEKTTEVKRGENRNRTLTNHNIVVDEISVVSQKEGSIQLTIPDWVSNTDQLTVVAYVTKNQVGITDAIRKEYSR